MHNLSDIPSIISYILAISGFILLLSSVSKNLAYKINSAKALGSHRYRKKIRDYAKSLGIAFVIVALLIPLITHFVHFK